MKKTIKIIDLLNLIANGERPKMIKYGVHNYEWVVYDYVAKDEFGKPSFDEMIGTATLNDEVEIIEEEKEIEELPVLFNTEVVIKDKLLSKILTENNKEHNEIIDKINELVRELNKIKKEGK